MKKLLHLGRKFCDFPTYITESHILFSFAYNFETSISDLGKQIDSIFLFVAAFGTNNLIGTPLRVLNMGTHSLR